jgi:hypothetical protein
MIKDWSERNLTEKHIGKFYLNLEQVRGAVEQVGGLYRQSNILSEFKSKMGKFVARYTQTRLKKS